MFVHRRRGWEIPESQVTPESTFMNRRALLGAGAGLGLAAMMPKAQARASADLYPVPTNPKFAKVDRPITDARQVMTYNNFYEFGTHKQIAAAAQQLRTEPWAVTFDGMVEQERTIDFSDLIKQMPLEERVYRLRCVEAWAAVVPYSGFPLKALVDFARPLSSAKYLRMETFNDASMAPSQRQFWYPWPYTEGLTMAEATNELAFIATGMYGKVIPKQNGAPLRLSVPWKYGFKWLKSIVRFTFTDERPTTFWSEVGPNEYGFWANVNPEVRHPRWSQASERMLGTDERLPTQLFNGYGEYVADIYANIQGERLFM
ncbi:MAG: protein-methionine-sulfoxide reductase catalytic subunit MsrP [Alphaproteobacteria bacterium]|nr:protein-methionine-sulfoxide reductase catalytic subunit MsrP [Alphaproteobacteria bacterium SS10]